MNVDPLFREIDAFLSKVINTTKPAYRLKLTRKIALALRASQQKRIARQQNPDGEDYAPRRRRIFRTQEGVKFLWKDEVRELSNWHTSGRGEQRAITGYDVAKGALRTFYKRDIQRYIEIHHRQSKRATGNRNKMFRRLRTARFLKARYTPNAAVVGFSGSEAAIARVHQYGLVDGVNAWAKAKYPQRELLGLTPAEWTTIIDEVSDALINDL